MQSPIDLADWARSGAMALTGRRDGPPMLAGTNAATTIRTQLDALGPDFPGLLGERAAYAGLSRQGPWSCGGAMRILPAANGQVALSLARTDDVALLPALLEMPVAEPWKAVTSWAATTSVAEIDERMRLLGLPGGAVRTVLGGRPAVITTTLGRRELREHPTVIDLTSLWAGPLCAHLLGLNGARVIKVESVTRPDGARFGPPAFYRLLHQGHEEVSLDLTRTADLERLRALIAEADLVLESSRSRGLRHLGIDAADVVADGTSWLSITACGREDDAVGFGDDIAARAGLVVIDQDEFLPAGDALADPVAGVRAAVEATHALASADAALIDLSMIDVVAETIGPVPQHEVHFRNGAWWVEHDGGLDLVRDPEVRR